jgi:hypothetical protein
MLFNIFLDTTSRLMQHLLSHLELNVGYETDEHLAGCRHPQYHRPCWVILYADDTVINTDSQAALQIMDQAFSQAVARLSVQRMHT